MSDAVDLAKVDVTRTDWGARDVEQQAAWQTQLVPRLASLPASAATRDFSVSFKLCRVSITRPWFKLALLSTPSWWMYDTPAGAYSSGSLDTAPGLFPLITTGFIAVRDLRLTAAWSAEDRECIGRAASFGCFDVRGARLNGATLEQPGLQVIAFSSRVLPKLPPLSHSSAQR